MHYSDNYAWRNWRRDGFAEDGDIFEGANLCQAVPATPVGLRRDGTPAKGLLFRRCNLFNCLPPEDAIVEECLTAQVEHCSHLHPELVEHGLPECPDPCPHQVGTLPVWQPTGEETFRDLKADLAKVATARVTKVQDALGVVTEQRFEVLAPLYQDKALAKWRPAKAGMIDGGAARG
jgi:hypothetical protein